MFEKVFEFRNSFRSSGKRRCGAGQLLRRCPQPAIAISACSGVSEEKAELQFLGVHRGDADGGGIGVGSLMDLDIAVDVRAVFFLRRAVEKVPFDGVGTFGKGHPGIIPLAVGVGECGHRRAAFLAGAIEGDMGHLIVGRIAEPDESPGRAVR